MTHWRTPSGAWPAAANGPGGRRPRSRWPGAGLALLAVLLVVGCAKYNTYYNAERAFDEAEAVREEQVRRGEDLKVPSGTQKQNYEIAIRKCQKILDEYPGHSLTDDALFLMGKAHQRLGQNLSSIKQLNLLFTNFPQTPYLEEALYLQAVNYLVLGDAVRSQDFLDRLDKSFPDSEFRSQAMRSTGDNAFALEEWEEARDAFRHYLNEYPEVDDWDDVGLKLARAHWELEEYAAAAAVLPEVIERTESNDRRFRAKLLLARSLVRLGDTAAADEQLAELRSEAEIYGAQGDVLLAEAESLVAQGQDDEAAARLETMPEEWRTREVKPRVADMLGYIYLRRDELEEARTRFQEAISGGKLLEDPEGSRRLLTTIQDFLAAENQLPDADPPRAARLRLLQANALLFGFKKPHRALDLYTTVAADTAADSTVAARALYGAMLVHRTRLDNPDSAQIFSDRLEKRYPDSAQAYEARMGRESDLLGYLLAQRAAAAAAAQERGETGEEAVAEAGAGEIGATGTELRRRRVYLQRRPDLIYPPPSRAVIRQDEMRRAREDERARQQLEEAVQSAAEEEAGAAAGVQQPAAEREPDPIYSPEIGGNPSAPPDTTRGDEN